ncbi:MAG: NAD(P)-dependent oxidoreductase [Candidatus Aenigmatarchaeota archaeon]
MKIGFFEAEGWEKEILEKEFVEHNLIFTKDWLTKENVENYKDIDILSIFISSKIDKEIIDSLPNLKFIATRSTGFDHIDIDYCKKKGIIVSNVPEYGTKTVAEWTIGLMLNLMRKIYYAIDQIKEAESFDLSNLRGEELYGKTLGVIGTGRIGKEVIKLAKAFGMNILAYGTYQDENFAKEYNFKYVSLEELLKNSDVITIHTKLTPSTYHLINKNNIHLIKKGAYLINTARGGIIETEALIYALKEGILKGAALDVLEEETEIKEELEILAKQDLKTEEIKTLWQNHILMKMPNVLITPHTAFNSKEAIERILKITIENIKGFLSGNYLNIVNR